MRSGLKARIAKKRNVTWNQRKEMSRRETSASANVISRAKTPVIARLAGPYAAEVRATLRISKS
jgi:hypothetical protein